MITPFDGESAGFWFDRTRTTRGSASKIAGSDSTGRVLRDAHKYPTATPTSADTSQPPPIATLTGKEYASARTSILTSAAGAEVDRSRGEVLRSGRLVLGGSELVVPGAAERLAVPKAAGKDIVDVDEA